MWLQPSESLANHRERIKTYPCPQQGVYVRSNLTCNEQTKVLYYSYGMLKLSTTCVPRMIR